MGMEEKGVFPDLRKVGEAMSGYLEPGCLRPDWPPAGPEVGLDLGGPGSAGESAPPATFSLSVWLGVPGPETPPTFAPASRRLVWTKDEVVVLVGAVSMATPRPPPPEEAEDLAGRGSERYCRGMREALQPSGRPSSWGSGESSRLVLRSALPRPAEDLGSLPSVAEPPVIRWCFL